MAAALLVYVGLLATLVGLVSLAWPSRLLGMRNRGRYESGEEKREAGDPDALSHRLKVLASRINLAVQRDRRLFPPRFY